MKKIVDSKLESMLAKKVAAQTKSEEKLVNLVHQIEVFHAAKDRLVEGIEDRAEEIRILSELRDERLTLVERSVRLTQEMESMLAEYDSLGFDPDRYITEWLAERGFEEKKSEREGIDARLAEIEKIAGKTYYNR